MMSEITARWYLLVDVCFRNRSLLEFAAQAGACQTLFTPAHFGEKSEAFAAHLKAHGRHLKVEGSALFLVRGALLLSRNGKYGIADSRLRVETEMVGGVPAELDGRHDGVIQVGEFYTIDGFLM